MNMIAGGVITAILEKEIERLRAENKKLKEKTVELASKNKALQGHTEGLLKLFKKRSMTQIGGSYA